MASAELSYSILLCYYAPVLKAIAREQTLVERAQEQLEGLILSGAYQPGERLPSEAKLGLSLEVSRTVVREAVRQMVAKGLVETRNGSGIYVRAMGPNLIEQPMQFLLRAKSIQIEQILEVRYAMEVEIAGLAAARADPDDIGAMEETLRRMVHERLPPAEFAQVDVEFHRSMAAATKNPLFVALAGAIGQVMMEPLIETARRHGQAAVDLAIRDHKRVLDPIKSRNVEGAREAMRKELREGGRILITHLQDTAAGSRA